MTLLLLVVVALTALAVYYAVRAFQARSTNKQNKLFRPDIVAELDGHTNIVLLKGDEQKVVVDTVPNDLDPLDRRIRLENAWDEAEAWAKDLNK